MPGESDLDIAIQQVDDLIAQLQTARPAHHPVQDLQSPAQPVWKSSKPAIAEAKVAAKTPKAKAEKPKQKDAAEKPAEFGLFAKAELKVAKVESVEEIDSAKLLKCTVSIGQGTVKHVMAGLKQHIARGDLLGSLVVVITNLKPAKLAGELSEVMILAAQAQDEGSPQGEVVKVLQTPEGSQAGDVVYLQDSQQSASYPKVLKSDIWKKIVADFKALDGAACYLDKKLITKQGIITLPQQIPNGAGIH